MKRWRGYVLPCFAVVMLGFSLFHLLFAGEQLPKEVPLRTPPSRGFAQCLSGTGLVEARAENISIGAAVPGIVLDVLVTSEQVGHQVEAGTPLFRVDDRHLRTQLLVHQANLQSALAQWERIKQQPRAEELPISEAKVRAEEANAARMKDAYERGLQLANKKVMADEEVISRKYSYLAAEEMFRQAEANDVLLKSGAWRPDRDVAEAAVHVAEANVRNLETEIERCLVRAPVAGQILKIDVRPGEYVAANSGKALVMLGDLRRLHVRVDIDEQDIPRFDPQRPAVAMPRGAAELKLPLKFVRIEPYVIPKKAFSGENTERIDTRVLQVLYEIDSSDTTVYVGQQMDVSIESPR